MILFQIYGVEVIEDLKPSVSTLERVYNKIKTIRLTDDVAEVEMFKDKVIKGGFSFITYKDHIRNNSPKDNHFISQFIKGLFTMDDYDKIKPCIGLYSRFTWFYKLSRFMKHRKKLHDLEKILNRRFKENKPQFTFFFNGKDFEISLLDNKESKHLQELLRESKKALKIFLNLQQRFRDELLMI